MFPKITTEQRTKIYYYHADHLQSAQFISDVDGKQYEHIEYTPYGELWIEEVNKPEKTPFRFTGKELDEETGLYYYGARYLDPKYSRWLSGDPALGEYIPEAGADTSKLPNGGAYNSFNFAVFTYANNNPIKYNDPTGEVPIDTLWDAGNVIIDLGRMAIAKINGNDEAFESATADLVLDSFALAVPYLPAGASKIAKGVTFTAQTAKGVYDSYKSYEDGDVVSGTLTAISTVVGVGSAGLNKKLDVDISDATKRIELVPKSMRINQTCKIIRAENAKKAVNAGNLTMKGISAVDEALATDFDKNESKTNIQLIYKKEFLMEKGLILCE